MSSNEIRVLGDLELSGALTFGKNFNDFPQDPKPRTIIIKQGQAYMYTELVNGSGYFTWQPIGVKQTSYLHTQGVASTTWTVTHNFNSTDFAYFVYDNNHRLVIANIEIIDSNTARILLSEAMTGTAVFFSVQYVSAPAINAAESITVKTLTLRDASGVLTINNNIVAMEESVAARFALVYTATQANTAIATAVSAEAVLRAAADEALGARIDAVLSNIDTGALDSLTELLAAFQGADANLNSAITALGTSATSALAAEATARATAVTGAIATASADATAKVLAEANIRSANDATVLTSAEGYTDTSVGAEATVRATAVTAAIATAASDATSKVAVETAARISNDATTLSSANTAMATAVNAEAMLRSSADAANLSTAKVYADNAVTAEATARNTAISAEATRATAAEAAAIATAATDATSKVAAEAALRVTAVSSAISTAATDATSKVLTETNARIAAVSSEVTSRTEADAATLVSAKTYADGQISTTLATLSSSVNTASSSASDYTDTKIAAEVLARVAGDATTLASGKTYADNAVTAEASARDAAIATAKAAALVTAAATADTKVAAEETARAIAVTAAIVTAGADATAKVLAETNARINNINAEAGRATTAEATLASAVNTEVAARTAGDTSAIASAKTYTDGAIVPAVQAYLGAVTADIIPAVNLVGNLGSPTHQFHSVYVGPGTLYVNGKPVIQDNSDTITFSTDPDQNLRIETKGNGHLQLQTGLGVIDVNSTLAMQSGKRITDAAGIQVEFGNAVQMNSNKVMGLGTPTLPTDASNKSYVDGLTTGDSTLVRTSGAQLVSGVKTFVDGIVVQGDFTVTGTTTTINSVTLKIADNIIDLNSDFISGTATENAGIRVIRGDEPSTQVRWNETGNKWELTNDGATYSGIATASDLAAKSTTLAGDIVGTGTSSISTVLSSTGVTSGVYGSAGSVATFNVDAKGRLTTASTTAISITNSQVSDFSTGVRALHTAGTGIVYTSSTGVIAVDSTIATKVYADASSTTALTTAKAYTDSSLTSEVTARNTAITSGNTTTLASAKTYTDSTVSTEVTARNTAIAAGDAATLVSAKTYTDSSVTAEATARDTAIATAKAAALVTANAYTDTVAATASGVTSGNYGNASSIPSVTVNAQGKITSITSNTVSVTSAAVSDFVEAAEDAAALLFTTGTHTGIAAAYNDVGNALNLSITATGVTAATYGSSTSVPSISVAADGRISLASTIAIAFPVTSVAGKTGAVTLSTTDVSEGTNLYYTAARASAAAPVQSVFGRSGAVVLASADVTTALGFTPENAANKGAANGYAPLGSDSKISAVYLPSYVDDVLEATNTAAFPVTGETGKIYVALDTNKTYRWGGSVYVEISAAPGSTDAVTEGSTNLYFTTARARAAVSAGTGISYSSSTGVIASTITQYTDTMARAAITAGTGITVTSGAVALTSGVSTTGSYNNVTVDTYGRVTAGSTVAYLTSYAETSTLATVTGRGATTSTAVTLNGGVTTTTITATTVNATSVVIDAFGTIDAATLTTSAVTAGQVLDSNSATAVRSVKYLIQATSGAAYQSVELLLIQDGTTVSIVEYANVATGADLADFDADISGGNVRLLVTPANAATVFKVMKTTVGV